MPNWAEVLQEIHRYAVNAPVDAVRRKYLIKYHEKTKRNVIAYYSGWLHVSGSSQSVSVNDLDVNGFMTAIHGLDCSLGLDLLLHTPGGVISAAEHIVTYLKSKFKNDVRAVVPQIAMSSGTMIACSCKSIVMGRQSCLGPIDPQVGGVPAKGVVEEFRKAIQEVKDDPGSLPIWQIIIGKYHPTFIETCAKAHFQSLDMVASWLKNNMLSYKTEAEIKTIVETLADLGHAFGHDRHISKERAQEIGLVIESMEDDQETQDLILTIHHSFLHAIDQGRLTKAIENHNGIGSFYRDNSPR